MPPPKKNNFEINLFTQTGGFFLSSKRKMDFRKIEKEHFA